MSDTRAEGQLLTGFHKLEDRKWRWTTRQFAVVLLPPPDSESRVTLNLRLFISKSELDMLGPITLTAKIGEVVLEPEKFTKSGTLEFSREVPDQLLVTNALPIVFSLDKALDLEAQTLLTMPFHPSRWTLQKEQTAFADGSPLVSREHGIVVTEVSLYGHR